MSEAGSKTKYNAQETETVIETTMAADIILKGWSNRKLRQESSVQRINEMMTGAENTALSKRLRNEVYRCDSEGTFSFPTTPTQNSESQSCGTSRYSGRSNTSKHTAAL